MDIRHRHDPPGRCVDADLLAGEFRRQHARLEQRRHHGDDAVAAHRAVALVVQEEYAEVRIGCVRWQHDAAVHVCVASRLPHQRPAVVVEPVPRIAPPRQHRVTFWQRHAREQDAQRLSAGVSVQHGDALHARARLPADRAGECCGKAVFFHQACLPWMSLLCESVFVLARPCGARGTVPDDKAHAPGEEGVRNLDPHQTARSCCDEDPSRCAVIPDSQA